MLSFKEKSSVQCGTTNQAITKGCPYVLPISTKVVAPSSRIFLTGRFTNIAFHASQQILPIEQPQKRWSRYLTWTSESSSGTACATASPLSRRRTNLFFLSIGSWNQIFFKEHQSLVVIASFQTYIHLLLDEVKFQSSIYRQIITAPQSD